MRGGGPYWGPGKPGGPIPPRHSGKACGSGDVRAVHPEAAWLSGQAWDARGPRWAGEASRALDTENTEPSRHAAPAEGCPLPPTPPGLAAAQRALLVLGDVRAAATPAKGHSRGGSPGHHQTRTPPCR